MDYKTEVATVISNFENKGFLPTRVWEGEEYVKTPTAEEALENVLSVEEATLYLRRSPSEKVSLLFIMGNGEGEAVADYGCSDGLWEEVNKIV